MKTLTEERIETAKRSLTDFLKIPDFRGKTFLDIGCGSGLFSYAAHQLNAARITSVDVDPFSVQCCRHLHEKSGKPANWTIHEGSILDTNFISQLGSFDIVYSWGVLPFTGDMWAAIRNSASLVKNGGLLYITIYNKTDGILGSAQWLKIKKFYNTLPQQGKHILEWLYIMAFFAAELLKMRNPFHHIRNYQSSRGMNWRTDINDWLGGLPFEYAKVEEVFNFIHTQFPDLELINIKTDPHAMGLNWFVFQKSSTQ